MQMDHPAEFELMPMSSDQACTRKNALSCIANASTAGVGTAQEGAHLNVVFMDNDILVFKPLARIFDAEDFDYGCTISDSPEMPVRML